MTSDMGFSFSRRLRQPRPAVEGRARRPQVSTHAPTSDKIDSQSARAMGRGSPPGTKRAPSSRRDPHSSASRQQSSHTCRYGSVGASIDVIPRTDGTQRHRSHRLALPDDVDPERGRVDCLEHEVQAPAVISRGVERRPRRARSAALGSGAGTTRNRRSATTGRARRRPRV